MAGAVIAAIIIGTLYVGREIFIPIALAILLSFALAPLVRLLQRLRFTWSSFGFMTWIWLSVMVILLGAELDTELSIRLSTRRPVARQSPWVSAVPGWRIRSVLREPERIGVVDLVHTW